MHSKFSLFYALTLHALVVTTVTAQDTAFTYQGRLNDGASAAAGDYDLRFELFDAAVSGAAQGDPITNLATTVVNGLFTVSLDFGHQFQGAGRWLEIAVRTNGGDAFTLLSPRQAITATPYALHSVTADSAGAVAAANVTGTISAAQLPDSVVTNGASGVNVSGTFTGDGSGLTGLNIEKATNLLVYNKDQFNKLKYIRMPGIYTNENYRGDLSIGQYWAPQTASIPDDHPDSINYLLGFNITDAGAAANTSIPAFSPVFESDWQNLPAEIQSEWYHMYAYPYSGRVIRPFYANYPRSTNKTSSAYSHVDYGFDVNNFRIGNFGGSNQNLIRIQNWDGPVGAAAMIIKGTLTLQSNVLGGAAVRIQGGASQFEISGYGKGMTIAPASGAEMQVAAFGGWPRLSHYFFGQYRHYLSLSNTAGMVLMPQSSTLPSQPFFECRNNADTMGFAGISSRGYFFQRPGGVQATNTAAKPARFGGTIKVDTNTIGNVGGGEDDLISYTVPADQLFNDREYLEFDCWGTFATNANLKRVRLYFGTAVLFDTTALGFNGRSWRCNGKVLRINATAQTATATFQVSGTLLSSETTTSTTTSSPDQTLTSSVVLKCTGEDSDGSAVGNSIVQNGLVIKWFPSGDQ